ncbi:MAG: DoxX family protein [Thermoanaerobaculia bacterium]
MSTLVNRWTSFAPQFLALLRIVAGLLFCLAGTSNLFAFPVGMPGGEIAQFPSQAWIGGVLEVVGGVLLILGLFTRPTAFVLSGEMAVAYFQFHAPGGFWPTVNGGVAAVLYCFLFLYLSAAGPGAWSLDGLRRANTTQGTR